MIKDLEHYLVLLGILGAGAGVFLYFRHERQLQLIAMIVTALGYFLWGMVHHYLNRDLNKSVVIEYTLVAGFAVVLIYTLLQQT